MRAILAEKRVGYLECAKKAFLWIAEQLNGGFFPGLPQDIACYYKAPTLFLLQGRKDLAYRTLDHIQSSFMQENGDFLSSVGLKSGNPAFVEFWVYTNGWIITSAQRLGRFDLSYPAWNFYRNYEKPKDVLSAAHLGLTALYMGDLDVAKECGTFLQKIMSIQNLESTKFYLRVNVKGDIIKDMPVERRVFEHVDQHAPNQAYFMIGYPLAYLVKLYQATKEVHYLNTAKEYFNWILRCTGNMRAFFFSHKVGWAASCYACQTQDARAVELAETIADYLVSIQEADGSFLPSADVLTKVDQTVEIAIWLSEMAHYLSHPPLRK